MSDQTTGLPATASLRWTLYSDSARARLVRFASVGATTTALYWALFLITTPVITATWAALGALTISTLVNTVAQRRYTFNSSYETSTAWRDHLTSLVAFGGAWLASVWALGLLNAFSPNANALSQLAVVQACTLVGSAVRFSLLQAWNARP